MRSRRAAVSSPDYLGVSLAFHQFNHEGALVELIQSARDSADALIFNPAAYSFTSVALFDALKLFEGPIIEGPHLQHSRERRTAPSFEAVGRGEGRDRRPRSLRIYRGDAGRHQIRWDGFPTRCRRRFASGRNDGRGPRCLTAASRADFASPRDCRARPPFRTIDGRRRRCGACRRPLCRARRG